MNIEIYKIIHLFGVFLVVFSVGGQLLWCINGGQKKHDWRKPMGIFHGLGLVLSILGGFGLIAKLGIPFPWPFWLWFKIAGWLFFAAVTGFAFKNPEQGKLLAILSIVILFLIILFVELKAF